MNPSIHRGKRSSFFSSYNLLRIIWVYAFLFLLIFKPFGQKHISGADMVRSIWIIQTSMMSVSYLMLRLHDFFMKQIKVGIPFLVLAIILGCSSLISLLSNYEVLPKVSFISAMIDMTTICAIPAFFVWIMLEKIIHSTYKDKAFELSSFLEKEKQATPIEQRFKEERFVCITGKNANDKLVLPPSKIICMMAAENYCIIYFINENNIENQMFRQSLSLLGEQVHAQSSNMVRCHRKFIVNTQHILSVEGNSRGYHLQLDFVDFPIPVSRNFPDIYLLKQYCK